MYPHHSYLRGIPGPAGYPARSPFLFGAPLVGGLLGGFLGSALFNYSSLCLSSWPLWIWRRTVRFWCRRAIRGISRLLLIKNGLHRLQAVFYRMISTSDIL